jgi:hypothetical protein
MTIRIPDSPVLGGVLYIKWPSLPGKSPVLFFNDQNKMAAMAIQKPVINVWFSIGSWHHSIPVQFLNGYSHSKTGNNLCPVYHHLN